MKETIVKYKCDICGSENAVRTHKLSVIFTTEQTEGRSSPFYFSITDIDLCYVHLQKALSGEQIFASGAMGCNRYWFKGENEE